MYPLFEDGAYKSTLRRLSFFSWLIISFAPWHNKD